MQIVAFMPGPQEMLIILLVVLVLFGAKRLPELARSLGKSMNEFKRGKEEVAREIRESMDETPEGAPPPKVESQTARDATETEPHKDTTVS